MKELLSALAAFQQECPTIKKDTEGYGYKYASLPSILEIINPLLGKYGLGFYQTFICHHETGARVLYTHLFHVESEKELISAIDVPIVSLAKMNDYQSLGSGITYLRRYALSSLLGIVTDEDNDASGQQTKKPDEELPWLTEKQYNGALTALRETEVIRIDENTDLSREEYVDYLFKNFRMKKVYREGLEATLKMTDLPF